MKLICHFLFMICFSITFGCNQLSNYKPSKHVRLAHQVTGQTANQLREEKGLWIFGISSGMMGDVQRMGMSFTVAQDVECVLHGVLKVAHL
jgi:methylglyoxal synthase